MRWRKNLFNPSGRYAAKRDFVSGLSHFAAGEKIVFKADYYSHYDGASVYEFQSLNDEKLKYWMLSDSESADSWHEFFEPESTEVAS
ncbi:MAG: hypothetical protein WA117_20730 [Verrucomicrobiia bacterium]